MNIHIFISPLNTTLSKHALFSGSMFPMFTIPIEHSYGQLPMFSGFTCSTLSQRVIFHRYIISNCNRVIYLLHRYLIFIDFLFSGSIFPIVYMYMVVSCPWCHDAMETSRRSPILTPQTEAMSTPGSTRLRSWAGAVAASGSAPHGHSWPATARWAAPTAPGTSAVQGPRVRQRRCLDVIGPMLVLMG